MGCPKEVFKGPAPFLIYITDCNIVYSFINLFGDDAIKLFGDDAYILRNTK